MVYSITTISLISSSALLYFFILSKKENYLRSKAERHNIENEASLKTVTSSSGQIVAFTRNGDDWNHKQYLNNSSSRVVEPLLPPSMPIVDLLEALNDVKRGLIVGVTHTGKTTLLRHMIASQGDNRTIVIDPHASPSKWANAIVVGTGRDYAKIGECLKMLISKMNKRYKEIGAGQVKEFEHQPILVIVEEWRAIVKALGKDAKEAIRLLLTESNKAAFRIFVTSQSDRAEPLGLDGEYDLKDSFAIIRLSLKNGQRSATLDLGDGETPVRLPGKYQSTVPVVRHETSDERFVRLVREGLSRSKASQNAYGKAYAGTNHVKKCKELLGE